MESHRWGWRERHREEDKAGASFSFRKGVPAFTLCEIPKPSFSHPAVLFSGVPLGSRVSPDYQVDRCWEARI